MDQDLTIPALRALRRILRASDLGNRQLAAATGLTPSQLLVLQEIGERRETTISVGDFGSEYLPLPYAPREVDPGIRQEPHR